MKIIFMGTPEFSCPTLQKLINDQDIEIVAVYTKEPKISGRGHKITNSPIHNLAIKNNLKIFTPKTFKSQEAQEQFINLKADAAIVVAYGLILTKPILDGTKLGCINIHPSSLPKWRGAAPIQRTLMSGDKKTSICIIKMNQGIDSGNILYEEKIPLNNQISYAELTPKLSEMGAIILLKTLKNLFAGKCRPAKQDDSKAIYAHKIEKSEAKIDWNLTAQEINNKIRALNGNIGAYFEYKKERIKILKAEIKNQKTESQIGEIKITKNELLINCADKILKLLIIQKSGGKPMPTEEFLKGFNL